MVMSAGFCCMIMYLSAAFQLEEAICVLFKTYVLKQLEFMDHVNRNFLQLTLNVYLVFLLLPETFLKLFCDAMYVYMRLFHYFTVYLYLAIF